MRHVAIPLIASAFVAALLGLSGGCTDKGEGLFGIGPDDRKDRGAGPDTVAVFAIADTYNERTVDDRGTHIIIGSNASLGLETVSFLRFRLLPTAEGELAEASLVLYSDAEITAADDYDIVISRLEEEAPDEAPYWPGPPNGAEVIQVPNMTTEEDTTSTGFKVYFVKIPLPVAWVTGWINDPETNYGLRLSGGTLDVGASGEILPRFRTAGQFSEGAFSLSPRLETRKTDQTNTRRWTATTDFYIYSPSLGPSGDLLSMQVGDVFGYRLLLRFPIEGFSSLASVNKALLTLKVDKSQPDVNQGTFDVAARPIRGGWDEDSTNVDVELDPASSPAVEVDADEVGEVVLDVTALVEVFAEDDLFNVAVLRTSGAPSLDGLALLTRENADTTSAPFLKLVFTTAPGGRYSD
jgi:hypothetical protein